MIFFIMPGTVDVKMVIIPQTLLRIIHYIHFYLQDEIRRSKTIFVFGIYLSESIIESESLDDCIKRFFVLQTFQIKNENSFNFQWFSAPTTALINNIFLGIAIWVLTGDKPETAINIAYSAKLFQPQMELLRYLSPNIYSYVRDWLSFNSIIGWSGCQTLIISFSLLMIFFFIFLCSYTITNLMTPFVAIQLNFKYINDKHFERLQFVFILFVCLFNYVTVTFTD